MTETTPTQPQPPRIKDLAIQLEENDSQMIYLQHEITQLMSDQLREFQNQLAAAQQRDAEIREAIKEAFELTGREDPYDDGRVRITYVKPTQRIGIDMDKFRIDHPDLVEQYKKITNVKGHVKIKVKD